MISTPIRSSNPRSKPNSPPLFFGTQLASLRASPFRSEECAMRLTGYSAIEFAEKHNMPLSKHADAVDDPADGLSIAEAEAIAEDDEELIYLDVADDEYANAPPSSYEPDR
jgi:hypothetical protein